MSKVIKISVAVISTLVLLSIILPLGLSLLLSVPAVQNYAARTAARKASEFLGTRIEIGRVDVKLINRVVVEDFYVEDFTGDTLLYVKYLDAAVLDLGLAGKGLVFGTARLYGGGFHLRQGRSGEMNVKEIVSKIRGDRPKGNGRFHLSINRIEASDMDFTMRLAPRPYKGGVNYSDMQLRGFTADLDGLSIGGGDIVMGIDRLVFTERSGFEVRDMSVEKFTIRDGKLLFEHLNIQTPDSFLSLPHLYLVGDAWSSYKNFTDSVEVDAVSAGSTVSTASLQYFVPSLAGRSLTLEDVDLSTRKTVSELEVSLTRASVYSSEIALEAVSRGLPDLDKARIDVHVSKLATSAAGINAIMRGFAGRTLPQSVARMISNAGKIHVEGDFTGGFSDFEARAELSSAAGGADLNVSMRDSVAGVRELLCGAVLRGFNVGRVAEVENLGRVWADASFSGTLSEEGGIAGAVEAEVSGAEFLGYRYHDIKVDGRVEDRSFDGRIVSADSNLDFDFGGVMDFNSQVPWYDVALNLRTADLARIGINTRDSVSVLSAVVSAHAHGIGMDNLNGYVEVADARYVYDSDTLATSSMKLTGKNSEHSKYLNFTSEFMDIEFQSRLSYRDMFDYLKTFLRGYLPVLYEGSAGEEVDAGDRRLYASDASSYSLLTLDVKNADRLLPAVVPYVQLSPGTSLSFMFNPYSEQFSLSARSDYVEYKNILMTKVNVSSGNRGDSLSLYVNSEDFYAGKFFLPNLAVMGGAKDGHVNLSTMFSNEEERFSALLGLRADMTQTEDAGMRISMRFSPSYVTRGDKRWQIMTRGIVYDTQRIVIRDFAIRSGDNLLRVDGVASRNAEDTLRLTLHDFDIGPLLNATSEMGYRVGGSTNGYADMSSALRGGRLFAHIMVDSMHVNDVRVAPLLLESGWDFQSERVRFDVLNRRTVEQVVRGFFSPADGRFLVNAKLDSLDLSLMNPVLGSVIADNTGKANASVRVTGTMKHAVLGGVINIPHYSTRIPYTNVTYSMHDAVIDIADNVLSLRKTSARDSDGGSAEVGLTVNLNSLKDVRYDVSVRPDNVLVLNTTEKDNSQFYGKVYASGYASIRGSRLGTEMTVVATTKGKSEFFLPLGGKRDFTQDDFIVFRDAARPAADSANYLVRKKMMYERKQRQKSRGPSSLSMNMTVNVTPDAEFQLVIDPSTGDVIKGRGQGTVDMHINPKNDEFSMYGTCSITEGSYQLTLLDLAKYRFEIADGSSITWTGEPEDALLDITAVYRLKTSIAPLMNYTDDYQRRPVPVECLIYLSDRLSQPTVRFDVQVPTADTETKNVLANALNSQESVATQFFWLLAFKSFISEGATTAQTLGAGSFGSSATGFQLLSNSISNWLSTSKYNIIVRYIPQSETANDEFDFGFTKELIDNRLILEIEGNYMVDRASVGAASNASNLTGDFYLTWLIDRAGNLKLKGFSQTIDRFDENQGLQENGIGIYYKKDFNTLGDVFREIKQNFANFGARKRAKIEQRAQRQREKRAGRQAARSGKE